jgi:hypothetical protein
MLRRSEVHHSHYSMQVDTWGKLMGVIEDVDMVC